MSYRDELEAAHYLNEHLEMDVKELSETNTELVQYNARLEAITKELVRVDAPAEHRNRIAVLEEENARLVRENSVLRSDPHAMLTLQLEIWVEEKTRSMQQVYKEFRIGSGFVLATFFLVILSFFF